MGSIGHPTRGVQPPALNVRTWQPDEPSEPPPPSVRAFAKVYFDLQGRISDAAISHYVRLKNLTRGRGLLPMTIAQRAERMHRSSDHLRRLERELARVGLIRRGYSRLLILDELGHGSSGNLGNGEEPGANRAQTGRKPGAETGRKPGAMRPVSSPKPGATRPVSPPLTLKKDVFRKDEENVQRSTRVSRPDSGVEPTGLGGPVEMPRASGPTDREREAFRLVDHLRGRGVVFCRGDDGAWKWGRPSSRADRVKLPDESEQAALARLKPEVVAILEGCCSIGAPGRASAPGGGGGEPKAPKVPDAVKREGRRLISRLDAAADEGASIALACLMVELCQDQDPETSYRVYYGQAEDARQGKPPMAPGLLMEAFEEACRDGVGHRGRVWTAAIKRLRSEAFQRGRHSAAGPALPRTD